MISSYNSTSQTIGVNEAYKFDTNRILTGCTVLHTPGTAVFTLTKPGYYYVTFNTTFTTTTTGDVIISLQNNGVTVPGATATESINTAGNAKSISFSTIIKVPPSCCAVNNNANLTFMVGGLAINATPASAVQITKLC